MLRKPFGHVPKDSKSLPQSPPSTRLVVSSGITGMKLLPSHVGSDCWDEGIGKIGRSREAGSWATAESGWPRVTEL